MIERTLIFTVCYYCMLEHLRFSSLQWVVALALISLTSFAVVAGMSTQRTSSDSENKLNLPHASGHHEKAATGCQTEAKSKDNGEGEGEDEGVVSRPSQLTSEEAGAELLSFDTQAKPTSRRPPAHLMQRLANKSRAAKATVPTTGEGDDWGLLIPKRVQSIC